MTIRSVSGNEPHESWGGWTNFLQSCEVRDEFGGVVHYGKVNCNYILFPDGTLLENYSVAGRRVMDRVRRDGADAVLAAVRLAQDELRALLDEGVRLHDAQHALNAEHPVAFPKY